MTLARCARCLFPERVCLCAQIPSIATRTHVVIVRHHLERFRSSNSGRLAHLALPNSELVEHGGREDRTGTVRKMPPLEGAWLLFPGSQARRMFRKLDALRGLPILRLPEVAPTLRLREAPTPDRVSTIEAIAAALRLLEGDDVAAPLEALFARAVAAAGVMGRRAVISSDP
jgi:DTW domain-containing protein YfiP